VKQKSGAETNSPTSLKESIGEITRTAQSASRLRYSLDSALDEPSKTALFCAIIFLVVIDPKCLQFQ
jgi:hypothetical protein